MRFLSKLQLILFLFVDTAFSLTISLQDANTIAERIWKNECKGTLEGLTHWNKGEDFASLGIGHFIWYPASKKDRFEETFPVLLAFLKKEGATLPTWLKSVSKCPWNSREEFYEDSDSSKMKSLREFLFDTRSLQAIFIAKRLEDILPLLIETSSEAKKEQVALHFTRLAKDANGLYALLDYLNFKGSGISLEESYKGQGWGLLQVLQRMSSTSKQPLEDFVEAAKSLLRERVRNSPPERHEDRWLKGWLSRLDTYTLVR
jgi:hypothetical protein